jgi:hypothetical protein
MKNIKSISIFIILSIVISLIFHQCKERFPEWYSIDFNRCIKGQVVSFASTDPVGEATIRIWVRSDSLNNYYGIYEDTLTYLTNENGFYKTEKISEALWKTGGLVIEASKPGWETVTWNSNIKYEYDPRTETWSRDDGDTLYVNFGLRFLWRAFTVRPDTLSFGNNFTALPIYILNMGAGQLDWEINHNDNWIIIQQNSGQIPVKQFVQVMIVVDRSGLSPGKYSSSIEIITNADVSASTIVIPVYVTVD